MADDPALWIAATRAPFLDGIADGSIRAQAFDRWLEQDHHFLQGLVRSWGLLLRHAPRQDFGVLVSGIHAFNDELTWFEGVAAQRSLDLTGPPLPAATAYSDALIELASQPYPVAMTGMWTVEAAYLAAWQAVAPGSPDYEPYVTNWASQAFADFVAELAGIVNRELPAGPTPEAAAAFRQVATHEAAFWAMTWTA